MSKFLKIVSSVKSKLLLLKSEMTVEIMRINYKNVLL